MTLQRAGLLGLLLILVLCGMTLPGDAPQTPIGTAWWPSEWGPNDQRGAANRLTAQKSSGSYPPHPRWPSIFAGESL
jgi:hypothetical protein